MKNTLTKISRLQIKTVRWVRQITLCAACFFMAFFFSSTNAYAQSYLSDTSAATQASFPWIDISATGTTLALADDAVSAALNLGFTFNYGGTDFTQVRVLSNGMLQFATTATNFTNAALPLNGTGGEPNIDSAMLPLWDDMQPNNNGNFIRFQSMGAAPNRVFVVSWLAVPYYCSNTSGTNCNASNQTIATTATFQAQIYEQGKFVYRYGVVDGSGGTHTAGATYSNGGATVGYEVTNTNFVQFSFNTGSVPNNTTILWSSNPAVTLTGRFNAFETSTAAGSMIGVIKTKVAGSAFNLDLVSINATKTAVNTAFTGSVKVELLNASDDSGRLDANGCRSTWTLIQTLATNPSFVAADAGRKKNVAIQENNSWPEVRVRITSVATATVLGCSTDSFAIRPSTLGGFAVTDTDAQTAGTTRTLNNKTIATTTLVHKAGRPFTVKATALNAQGSPATTTNYIGTPTLTLSACSAGTACTATFGTFAIGSGAAVAGIINSTTATYSDVGSFSLQLADQTFANVDATDGSTTAERFINSATIDVGRFVPDHFSVDLSAGNSPVLTNRSDIAGGVGCTPASIFTYMDENFGLKYRIEARTFSAVANVDGTTGTMTPNYTGAFAKGVVSLQAENNSAGTNLSTRITNGTGSWATGVNAVNITNAKFSRAASPDGPFDSLQLGVSVTDADGPILEGANMNPTTNNNCVTALNCTGVSVGTTLMRFGRARLFNAYGSELLNLPVKVELEYWNGNGFVDMGATDICTTFTASDIALSFPVATANHLVACETLVSLTGGLPANLKLTKPGSGNDGWTNIRLNLGSTASGNTCTSATPTAATTANKSYLRGNWGVSTFDQDPTVLVRFGSYRSGNGFIYFRENY
ncbi:MAG: DUF6701 domain-containing protein [Pseudomonadota bacterium]